MTTRTEVRLDVAAVENAIHLPMKRWAHNCHSISIAIIKAGLVEGRVARGVCVGVGGQHSWIVLGNDCYDKNAAIIDPTLWSYDDTVEGIWYGTYKDGRHRPHGGFESIWQWGRPPEPIQETIALTPKFLLSDSAKKFLELLGPLDRHGWAVLANHAPVGMWPAGEIYAAMDDTQGLGVLIPVDRLGMLTDRNPGGLYLKPRK